MRAGQLEVTMNVNLYKKLVFLGKELQLGKLAC